MKVAILAHDRYPISAPFAGGLESFTWHLAHGLRRRGIEVVLFAGPGSDPALGCEELPVAHVELSATARADVAMPPEAQVTGTMAYAGVMQALRERPDIDVVHNNSLHYLPIVLADSIPQAMLTTLHTPPHPWIEPALRLNPRAHTVAVSRWVATTWSAVTRSQIIPNGIDLSMWQAGPGGEDLVWCGRIVPEKAPHVAAKIAQLLGRSLRIAGPIVDHAYFRDVVEPLLGDAVTYSGHLGPEALSVLVGHSVASLVTPHWDEPYGLVAAEAISCGTPVLGLARGGLPEMVRPPGGECIAPDADPRTVVESLRRVMAFDRAAVRGHAETHCCLEQMIDSYVTVYESLA